MTRRRLLLLMLSLYPSWWRRRYGEEAAAVPEQSLPGAGAALDLPRGAINAWLRQRPPHEAFAARFSEEARALLVHAQEEARSLGHNYVGTEHIVLGLLTVRDGVAAPTLEGLGVSAEAVRFRIAQIVGPCPEPIRHSSKRCLRLTPGAKKALELSSAEADRLRHPGVATGHLLLGLLQGGERVGAQILADAGVTPERVREQILRRFGREERAPAHGQ